MAYGKWQPMVAAVAARKRGQTPTAAQLRLCEANRFKGGLECWNGKRPDRPHCNYVGSLNLPIWAAAGVGDYGFIAAVCALEAIEGDFGVERGSPGDFYYGGIMGIRALAYRELVKAGDLKAAEAVRLAIRSALAWDAITAIRAPRKRDSINFGGAVAKSTAKGKARPGDVTVAVSGMRWSMKGRSEASGLLTENSHSEILTKVALARGAFGASEFSGILTPEEYRRLSLTIEGEPSSASEVASWMFGTINTPNKTWAWRLRRTTQGAESIFLGQYPNPMKPMMVVSQISMDGEWTGMRPSSNTQNNHWADGFESWIEDGMIKARCVGGSAELPELGGDVIWQVDVDGSEVTFSTTAPPKERRMTICDLKNEASFNLPPIPRAEIDSQGRFIGGDPKKYLWPPGPRGKAQGALQSTQAMFGVGLDRGALRLRPGAPGAGVQYWEMAEFGNPAKWIPWTPLLDRDHYVAASSFNRYGAGWSFGPVHNLHDEAQGKFAELCGSDPDPLQKGDLDHDLTLYNRLDTEWRERFSVAPAEPPPPAPPETPPTPPATPTSPPSPPAPQPTPVPPSLADLYAAIMAVITSLNQIMHAQEATDRKVSALLDDLAAAGYDQVFLALEELGSMLRPTGKEERAWWTARLQREQAENEKWPRYLRKIEAILAAREAEDRDGAE